MGFRWPVWDVVTGSAVASISNLLPINLVANFGTLEAGWTAAFAAMGVNLDIAAATGLACHIWALVFAAVFGGLGWLVLGPARRD
jgi:energy-converting hydrogenase Eha subunit C